MIGIKNHYDLDIKAVDLKSHKKIFNTEEKKTNIRFEFWQNTRNIERRIFRHVQRDTVRSNKHY